MARSRLRSGKVLHRGDQPGTAWKKKASGPIFGLKKRRQSYGLWAQAPTRQTHPHRLAERTPHTSRTCPEQAGTVEGDFTTADVIGLTSQQLAAHDFAALLAAIRARQTYANLHTMDSPGGEIRGPIKPEIGRAHV